MGKNRSVDKESCDHQSGGEELSGFLKLTHSGRPVLRLEGGTTKKEVIQKEGSIYRGKEEIRGGGGKEKSAMENLGRKKEEKSGDGVARHTAGEITRRGKRGGEKD